MAIVGRFSDVAELFCAPALQPIYTYLRALDDEKSPESARIMAMGQGVEYKFALDSADTGVDSADPAKSVKVGAGVDSAARESNKADSGILDSKDFRIFAIEQSYGLKALSQGFYETHRIYVDVQVVLHGQELFHLASARDCEILTPYDEKRDLIIYRAPEKHSVLHLYGGMAAVFFPYDVHAGGLGQELLGTEPVYKSVLKVPLHLLQPRI